MKLLIAVPAEGSVPLLEFFGLLDEKQRQKLLSHQEFFKRGLCTHYFSDHLYFKHDRTLWGEYCLPLF